MRTPASCAAPAPPSRTRSSQRRSAALGLLLCLGGAGLPLRATASPLTDALGDARTALAAQDAAGALKSIEGAMAAAESLESVGRPGMLGRAWFYKGLALQLSGKADAATDAWRMSLIIDNEHQWEEALYANGPLQDLYEALRKEVRDRSKVDAQVPEAVGAARLYVDGERVKSGATVLQGAHLAQVECPDGTVHGAWTDFSKKFKWLKLCPAGVDTTVVVADAEAEDEWAGFGPAFGEEASGGDAGGGDAAGGAVADAGRPVTDPATPGGGDTGPAPLIQHRVSWPLVAAGGGALAVSGALYAVTLSRRSAFDDPANTDLRSAAAIQDAAKGVNTAAGLTLGFGMVGAGLCAAAVIPW